MKARMWRLRHWWDVKSEKAWGRAAGWLPRTLVYYAVIRAWAHATTGQHGNTHPEAVRVGEILDRWGKRGTRW